MTATTSPAGARTHRDLIRQADELDASGRALEAIDLLTAANRSDAAPELERHLLTLRHHAYDQLPTATTSPDWPPEQPDLVAGHGDPPEVEATDLTAATLAAGIRHHGCLLVRNLLDTATAEDLIAEIDRAFEACDQRNGGAPLEETGTWFHPFRPLEHYPLTVGERWWVRHGGGVWTVDAPRAFWKITEAFEAAGLRPVIEGYLGQRAAMSLKKCTLRRVPVDTGTDWHQDGAFLGRGIRSVNVWLALTDCGVDAPGLDLVPQRLDLLETGTNGAQFDWSVGPGTVEAVAGTDGVESPHFRAGDALLFDDVFLHRTGVKPGMTKERYAIESWFFAPTHYPKDQVPIVF